MLTIDTFLNLYGLDLTKKVKIARHMDTRGIDVHELFHTGHFELYQSYQERDEFKGAQYLVSCLGINNNQALFVGVYEVVAKHKVNGFPDHHDVPYRGKAKIKSKYHYELEKLDGFEDIEHRLVIRWNNVGQAWCVSLDNRPKEVVQLLPRGFVKPFSGYSDINLTYRELRDIVGDLDANQIWYKMLSSVGAVYLILDTTDGKQYIGSASGREGLYGRWKEYAKTGHGNNVMLKEMLQMEPGRVHKFRFSILQVLPASLTSKEAVMEENKFKEKLGSRAHGLNEKEINKVL
ncbi:GIY-YIG nuclease family protein (plasmid) [Rossellomorea sp. AcN35-11]|nr:GIY-YIG nuclease family protein [Rossellomorea aquimaris]WJV32037.1 GIY-YIG nuclease family protein [Rossellomorea sp. AcN35-11]